MNNFYEEVKEYFKKIKYDFDFFSESRVFNIHTNNQRNVIGILGNDDLLLFDKYYYPSMKYRKEKIYKCNFKYNYFIVDTHHYSPDENEKKRFYLSEDTFKKEVFNILKELANSSRN